jgi:hypothetical protein
VDSRRSDLHIVHLYVRHLRQLFLYVHHAVATGHPFDFQFFEFHLRIPFAVCSVHSGIRLSAVLKITLPHEGYVTDFWEKFTELHPRREADRLIGGLVSHAGTSYIDSKMIGSQKKANWNRQAQAFTKNVSSCSGSRT